MNKLNIEALGLQEMTKDEMIRIRGGQVVEQLVDANTLDEAIIVAHRSGDGFPNFFLGGGSGGGRKRVAETTEFWNSLNLLEGNINRYNSGNSATIDMMRDSSIFSPSGYRNSLASGGSNLDTVNLTSCIIGWKPYVIDSGDKYQISGDSAIYGIGSPDNPCLK